MRQEALYQSKVFGGAILPSVFAVAALCSSQAVADDDAEQTISAVAVSAQSFVDDLPAADAALILTARAGALDLEWAGPSRDPGDQLSFVGRDVIGVDRFARFYGSDTQRGVSWSNRNGDAQTLFAPWGEGPVATAEYATTVSFNSSGQWRPTSSVGRFEVDVTPRANVELGSSGQSVAGAGALVRFGEGLVKDGRGVSDGGWFLFIGADAQALTWRPRSSYLVSDGGVALEDMVIVGDAQAGIAWRTGLANVAFALVHREYNARGYKTTEDYAGISIAWEY